MGARRYQGRRFGEGVGVSLTDAYELMNKAWFGGKESVKVGARVKASWLVAGKGSDERLTQSK